MTAPPKRRSYLIAPAPDTGRDLVTEEFTVNMGPQHPSTHGVLRLEIVTDGEIVVDAVPHLGYLHRNFEKHAENEGWQQVVPYCDRLDYLASMNMDHGYALAVEKLAGIEPNRRVQTLRVLFAELQRIASHIVAIGTYGLDLGAMTPFWWLFRDREMILDIFETVCGARLLYNFMWVGGLSHDLQEGMEDRIRDFVDYFEPRLREVDVLLTDSHIFIERTADVGVLPAEVALEYACTGPVLRGSGVEWDLRRDEPYDIYPELDFDIVVGQGAKGTLGDCWDRYWVRLEEMRQSCRIIRQILDRGIPEGDVRESVPKKLKVPAGECYARSEAPRGELGFYLASGGKDRPERVRCRSGCFCNLSALPELVPGVMLGDLVAIIGSVDIVLGEVDR